MDGVYEAIALVMRFWFVFVGIVVLLGVTSISIREYRDKHYVLGIAQRSIGYLNIVSGPEDIIGDNIQLMRENTLGRSRRVDIMLNDTSVGKAHSQLYLSEGRQSVCQQAWTWRSLCQRDVHRRYGGCL